MTEGEEGAPDFFDGAAVFAEAGAGGQVDHPDADDGEDDQAGDPGVDRDLVVVDAGGKPPIIGARRARTVPSSLGFAESGSGWLSDMTPMTMASRTKAMRVWVRNKRASRARSPGVLSCEMSRSNAMGV